MKLSRRFVRAPRTINGFHYGECGAKPKNAGKTLRSVHLAARQAAGLPLEKCDLHKTSVGGGFGRRGAPTDYVRQAVTVAKAMPGTPIKAN